LIVAFALIFLLAGCDGRPKEMTDAETVKDTLQKCGEALAKVPDGFPNVELSKLYLEAADRACAQHRIESKDTCETALYQATIATNSYRHGELGQVSVALDEFKRNQQKCLADLGGM
jgi:hypothetical protein